MAHTVIERIDLVFGDNAACTLDGVLRPPQYAAGGVDADLDAFLEREISERISRANITWRKLELCFKWAKLREYLGRRGISADSDAAGMVRSLLRDKQLMNVEYDARGQVITRLNHDKCLYIDDMPVTHVTQAVGG